MFTRVPSTHTQASQSRTSTGHPGTFTSSHTHTDIPTRLHTQMEGRCGHTDCTVFLCLTGDERNTKVDFGASRPLWPKTTPGHGVHARPADAPAACVHFRAQHSSPPPHGQKQEGVCAPPRPASPSHPSSLAVVSVPSQLLMLPCVCVCVCVWLPSVPSLPHSKRLWWGRTPAASRALRRGRAHRRYGRP